jgi:hypothetical protein
MWMNNKHYNTSDEGSTLWILLISWAVIALVIGLEYLAILGFEWLMCG